LPGQKPETLGYAPAAPAQAEPRRVWTAVRIWSAVIFVVSGAMLLTGALMRPSVHGIGTHAENLGLPPCGFYLMTGVPCPTCGCTTAVTWVAHGHVAKAFFVQPFGAVVGLLAAAGTILGCAGVLWGKWFGPSLFTLQWHWRALLWGGGLLLAGGWVYKILMVRAGFR
jgi:hypothetical protein